MASHKSPFNLSHDYVKNITDELEFWIFCRRNLIFICMGSVWNLPGINIRFFFLNSGLSNQNKRK